MEGVLIAIILVKCLGSLFVDGAHAARGHRTQRHEYRMAKLAARPGTASRPARSTPTSGGGVGRYLSALWSDAWDDVHDRHDVKHTARKQARRSTPSAGPSTRPAGRPSTPTRSTRPANAPAPVAKPAGPPKHRIGPVTPAAPERVEDDGGPSGNGWVVMTQKAGEAMQTHHTMKAGEAAEWMRTAEADKAAGKLDDYAMRGAASDEVPAPSTREPVTIVPAATHKEGTPMSDTINAEATGTATIVQFCLDMAVELEKCAQYCETASGSAEQLGFGGEPIKLLAAMQDGCTNLATLAGQARAAFAPHEQMSDQAHSIGSENVAKMEAYTGE